MTKKSDNKVNALVRVITTTEQSAKSGNSYHRLWLHWTLKGSDEPYVQKLLISEEQFQLLQTTQSITDPLDLDD